MDHIDCTKSQTDKKFKYEYQEDVNEVTEAYSYPTYNHQAYISNSISVSVLLSDEVI